MNILILSAGTRNKIVQYFRKELAGAGKVIATDCSELAPAIYEADGYYIVPRITDPDYINIILNICKKEKIDGVFSLIDPELSILAKNKENFRKLGVMVIGSSEYLCDMSLDKFALYQWLEKRRYKTLKSYITKEDFEEDLLAGKIGFPVFTKPRKGSASIQISCVENKEFLDLLWKYQKDLMVQEYINGQEIGADVYIDMISGEVTSIFTKKKIKMRAGETDKSVSFKNLELCDLIIRFVKEAGYRGQIDIDFFEVNGEFYILEVNPRFGGGYPHAYECGANHVKMIINNLKNETNPVGIGNYKENICMMKYNDIMLKQV